jgi:hypothetical protein
MGNRKWLSVFKYPLLHFVISQLLLNLLRILPFLFIYVYWVFHLEKRLKCSIRICSSGVMILIRNTQPNPNQIIPFEIINPPLETTHTFTTLEPKNHKWTFFVCFLFISLFYFHYYKYNIHYCTYYSKESTP